jgi:hypothetical protein
MINEYAGIGARTTPLCVMTKMESLARKLASIGYLLRSGGAAGADVAFEKGSVRKKIYLPYKGYNGHHSKWYMTDERVRQAYNICADNHPAWPFEKNTSRVALRKLIARNVYIILGDNLDYYVDFLVCWTPKGKIEGGTGFGIRVAQSHGIKVFNLYDHDTMDVLDYIMKVGGQ